MLDFLGTGDVVSVSTVLPTSQVSLRAITNASLVVLDSPESSETVLFQDYWTFLMARCTNQLTRTYVHQLMIGRLETEPRVASFILALALRSAHRDTRATTVALPMSRDDIADYLVINCDTLSRTMMKFCDSGLIDRESRHAIRVLDLEALKKKSPLATLLSAVFMNDAVQPDLVELAAKRSEHFTSSSESPHALLPAGSAGTWARSGAEHPSASRHGL